MILIVFCCVVFVGACMFGWLLLLLLFVCFAVGFGFCLLVYCFCCSGLVLGVVYDDVGFWFGW